MRLSISQSGPSDIHWGLGAQSHGGEGVGGGGGGVSSAFIFWNLVSMRFSGPVGIRVRGNVRHPIKYPL